MTWSLAAAQAIEAGRIFWWIHTKAPSHIIPVEGDPCKFYSCG